MQTSNAKRNLNCDDTGWVLLAELPFTDFLSDQDQRDEPVIRSMFQTLRELGMSPEDTENIAWTVARFSREALTPTRQGRSEFPEWIRIFCQKKMIDDVNATISSRLSEQDRQQKQMVPDFAVGRIGGWGYFMIERGKDLLPCSSVVPQSYLHLYLYKEGE